ncbi:hypothetical protein K9L27_03405 [Candidatus Gracilibacteria bacterium]|nr:hypothetical protein [Candidatus Gracilibacteria bacterium]
MTLTTREQTLGFLTRSAKVLLVAPERIEADEAAAVFALQKILIKAGKEVLAVSTGKVPKNLSFLHANKVFRDELGEDGDFVLSIATNNTKVDKVKYVIKENSVDVLISPKKGYFTPSDVSFGQSAGKFDAILALGVESLESLGELFESHTELFTTTPLINISVSPNNEFFGKVNVVDPSRSSVSEIVFELFQKDQVLLPLVDKDIATCLLTGIIARTESFLDPVTTPTSFEAAALLQSMGADQSEIIEHIFKKKSLPTLKVWGRVLGNLELDMIHRIGWSAISKADFELADASPDDTGAMIDELLRYTKGSELMVLFIEDKKQTTIQVRSSNGNINFSDLQNFLGGSGKLVRNGLDFEVEKKSLAEIQYQMLRLMVDFQKKRLQIPAEVEIQKTEIGIDETIHPSQTELPLMKRSEPAVSPTPPAEIPFDAPMKDCLSEGGVHSDVPTGTRSAEITLNPNDSHVPDWLKKSFPNNHVK